MKQQGSSLADLIHVPNQRRWTGSKTPIHYEQPSRDNTDGADMRRWTGRKAPTQCEHPPRDDANDWSDAAVYGERHAERTKRPTGIDQTRGHLKICRTKGTALFMRDCVYGGGSKSIFEQ